MTVSSTVSLLHCLLPFRVVFLSVSVPQARVTRKAADARGGASERAQEEPAHNTSPRPASISVVGGGRTQRYAHVKPARRTAPCQYMCGGRS